MAYFWPTETLLVALVRRLGGDVVLTEEELNRAHEQMLEDDPLDVERAGITGERGQRLRLLRESQIWP